jgi:methionine biosynthesis protein MetW
MTPQKLRHIRIDLETIANLIPPACTVLDLGCGEGELLHKLIHEKNVSGHGVELFTEYICSCVEKGVPVIHADLNEGLGDYPDKSFDYVILSRTLQVVRRPDIILKEMIRVGKTCIVSFPNFGHWKIRTKLLFYGKMPATKLLPYEWYDTPNIHLSTIKDFRQFCKKENIAITREIYLANKLLSGLNANLFSELAIFGLKDNNLGK